MGGAMFEQLALNTTTNDIPTLIEVLKSPLILEPVAAQSNIPVQILSRLINIEGKTNIRSKEAKGVLKVSLLGGDRERSKLLLDTLSNTYPVLHRNGSALLMVSTF